MRQAALAQTALTALRAVDVAVTTSCGSAGFTNSAAFGAPPTITVSIAIVTRNAGLAQALYNKAGGAPPVYITSQNVWKYCYPVLVAVPAGG